MSSDNRLKAIIVDIDGTLANCEHRRHFLDERPKNWKGFYAEVGKDEPNWWCINLIDMYGAKDFSVVLVSGRIAEVKGATLEWLERWNVQYHALFMRNKGDFRDDQIVKAELYEQFIKPRYNVEFCIDDRSRIVEMWRSKGLVCLQCAKGDF